MRAAIYIRVSTDDKSQDLNIQLSELKRYVKAMEWDLSKDCVYSEQQSAFKGERPVFERMMDDARKRKFDVLLCYSFDRFSRAEPTKAFRDIDSLTRLWKIRFITVKDGIDSSNEMVFPIIMAVMATQAHNYSKLHGERVRAGMIRVQEESRKLGRPATKSGKPIGRPEADIPKDVLEKAREMLKTTSLRRTADDLDIGYGTLRRRLSEVSQKPS